MMTEPTQACGSSDCSEPAALWLVHWPGQSLPMCEACRRRADGIATVMGFQLSCTPIVPPEVEAFCATFKIRCQSGEFPTEVWGILLLGELAELIERHEAGEAIPLPLLGWAIEQLDAYHQMGESPK